MATFTLPRSVDVKGKRVAYVNARLFDPESGLDEKGALLTEGEEIADFGGGLFADGVPDSVDEVVDCGGQLLCPGLLDIQVHFREPGQEYKETIHTGSQSAAAGGVTTVVCQPNTSPVIDSVEVLNYVHRKARETGFVHVRSYAAISRAMKGEALSEMGRLVEAGAVGFTDDGLPVMNAQLMRRAMEYARELNVPVAQHAEDLNLSNGGCMNEGEVATRLGLGGIPNASEAVIVARDILLQQLTGCRYHVLHVSTREAMEAIRLAKRRGQEVTCEVSPHHFTLTDEAVGNYRTFAKMNPPLRSEADRAAMEAALCDGTADAIATDHAPHDVESKRVPMADAAFGIVGLETMLPLSLRLYHEGKTSLRHVLGLMTHKPADIIGVPAGRLKKGAPADLVLIDLDCEWVIDPELFYSKSTNSPFEETPVKGRATRTVVSGRTVYIL